MFDTPHENINEEILLFNGPGKIVIGSETIDGHVELKNSFLPKNKLKFSFYGLTMEAFGEIVNKNLFKGQLLIEDFNFLADITITSTNLGGDEPNLSGDIFKSNTITGEEGKDIDTLFFSVFNFPYVWSNEHVDKSSSRCARLRFPHQDYDIVIDSIPNLSKKYKELAKVNGHLITYNGFLTRKDGSPFKREEAEAILDILRNTLSFSQGRFIEVNYLKAIRDNKLLFQNVKNFNSYPTVNRVTWFDSMEPDSLFSVFKGMTNLANHYVWSTELGKALHWYYSSLNDLAMEISIVLNQSALELLIWCYFVEDKKSISKSKFKDMGFHERLEVMLEEIKHENLKYEPREHLERFRVLNCPDKPWFRAFTQVRNYIIHPDQKHKLDDVDYKPKWDVREIGAHLIEVLILYLCDFDGKAVVSMDKPFINGKNVSLSWKKA